MPPNKPPADLEENPYLPPGPEPLVFDDYTGGLNTNASRPGIAENEMSWCDGFFPLGKNNLRTLPGIGPPIFVIPVVPPPSMFDIGAAGATVIPKAVAYDVTPDGTVVFGEYLETSTYAFRWDATNQIVVLLPPTALNGSASFKPIYCSNDGNAAAGTYTDVNGHTRGFWWTLATGVVDIGDLGGSLSNSGSIFAIVNDISADGTTVVGLAWQGTGAPRGFRWTLAGGMVSLGTYVGGGASTANAVSNDGSVIAGSAAAAAGYTHAFRWTLAGGMIDIDTLSGTAATALSDARDISPDGQTIIGFWDKIALPAGNGIYRWTQAGGTSDLGFAGSIQNFDFVSDDGTVVAGTVGPSPTGVPDRWTLASGIVPISVTYAAILGLSPDGSVVIGNDSTNAFRWDQGGGLVGLVAGTAWDASSAGAAVVGGDTSNSSGKNPAAFRWTSGGGVVDLGIYSGAISIGMGISADGTVVIGRESIAGSANIVAMMWTRAGGRVNLGTLGGATAEALFISDDKTIIFGDSTNGGGFDNPFRWTVAGGMVDLGLFAGNEVTPTGISTDGTYLAGYGDTATRWTQATGYVDLGALGGSFSKAFGISEDGLVVVGQANVMGDGSHHAFKWTIGGGIVDLGTIGGANSVALCVSADGSVICGTGVDGSGNTHLFRWTLAGGIIDLGTLGGTIAIPQGMSADGSVIVGRSTTAGFLLHAFMWTQAGGMVDLGTLGGATSQANAVSRSGQVIVGVANNAGAHGRAFRWTAANGLADLGTLGGLSSEALAVSSDGAQVAGDAKVVNGDSHAFWWG